MSSVNDFLSLAVIFICLRSFPFLFDVIGKVSAFFAIIAIFVVIKRFVSKHILNKRLPALNKAVLITGCDSGTGYLLAQRFDQMEFHVFAGCLHPSGEGAQSLKERSSPNLQIVELDVTSEKSVVDAQEFVKKNLKRDEVLWAVVNNAGVPQVGEIEWTPMEEISRALEVNTLGTVRVTKAFLPLLRKSRGRVVNHTSLCGHLTNPGYVGYCMSKVAAVSFTTGLRMEMTKFGVKSISVEPFFFKTPMTETEPNLQLIEEVFNKSPPEIQATYGKEYINSFKQTCIKLLSRRSLDAEPVLQCFEDAITAEDPQPDYFPCYLPHKLILKLWRILPQPIVETLQLTQMTHAKPAALR